MNQVYLSSSPSETESIGVNLAKNSKSGDFYAFYGEMGSGKTVLIRGFVSALIPHALVSSPTYAILNVYEGQDITVNHFDMYRITSSDDLMSTGYDEIIQSGITVCEWPENIEEDLPDCYWKIVFEKLSENERRIFVERIGE